MCDVHFADGLDIVEVGKLTAGNDITTFHVNGFKCGIVICYDSCFDEFIKLYGKVGKIYTKTPLFQIWNTNNQELYIA